MAERRTGAEITEEQRARWRKEATTGYWMLWDTERQAARVLALLDALDRLQDLLDRTEVVALEQQHLARLSVREIRECVFPSGEEPVSD